MRRTLVDICRHFVPEWSVIRAIGLNDQHS